MGPFTAIIAGAGRAGGDLHLDAYRAIDAARVVALCDPDAERTRRLCEEKGVPNAYPSLSEGLAKHDVDVVSVCTPVQMHLESAKAAMDAGAHVLMEKPIAMTAAEAEEMKAYADAKDRRLGIVHNTKFQPGIRKALAIFQDGGVGEVLHIDQTWFRVGAADRMLKGGDYWVNELIGGRWGETLPHHLYVPYLFVGPMEVADVIVKDATGRWPWLPGDEVLVTLTTGSATVTVRMSENAVANEHHILITGTKGAMYVTYKDAVPLPVRAKKPKPVTMGSLHQFVSGAKGLGTWPFRRLRRSFGKPGGKPKAKPKAKGRATAERTGRGSHYPVIIGLLRHIFDGAPDPVPWEEAIWTMRTTEQIGRAIDARATQLRASPVGDAEARRT